LFFLILGVLLLPTSGRKAVNLFTLLSREVKMKSRVYSIRDIIIGNFCMPFYAINDDHAKRICADLVQRGEGTTVYDHPEDHDLHYIGTFDDTSGLIEVSPQPVFLAHLEQFREVQS